MTAIRIGVSRGALEVTQFFRERDAVVFTFLFPIMFLVLLASIFHGSDAQTGVPDQQIFVAGMISAGIASTSFLSLGVGIAGERDDGTLKRLAGTPMPTVSYFFGKVIMVAVVGMAETGVLLVLGSLAFGVHLPSTGGRWLTFVWVTGLGLVACSLLGVAVSGLPRSARSATAVINLPFVLLEFISGVFVPFNQLPHGLQGAGLPLPPEMDGPGATIGLPARPVRARRDGSFMGTRHHRANPRGLECRRPDHLHPDLPVEP